MHKVFWIVLVALIVFFTLRGTGQASASENEPPKPMYTPRTTKTLATTKLTDTSKTPELTETLETPEATATSEITEATLRLLSFNIHHGADGNAIFNLDATIATIRNSGANIIALQEVDRVWSSRSQYCDEARYIADQLGMNYVYGATLDNAPAEPGVGEYGMMILSKFAIITDQFYMLPGQLEQRGILYCTLQTPFGNLHVGCIHLGVTAGEREHQITALLDWLPQHDDLLVMGDFNTTPAAVEFQPWRERFRDLQEQCDLGSFGTFYYQNEWKRIDYIYAGSKWTPVNCYVSPAAISDHRPVYLELLLDEPGE